MTALARGLAIAAIHSAIVLSLAGKYAWDRERLPRVWARSVAYDPNLPIRGRYATMRLAVEIPDDKTAGMRRARLSIQNDRLIATPSPAGLLLWRMANGQWVINEPVAFFLPEHAPDPTSRAPGEELWVEVSVPRDGPPRPVRLGVKKDGARVPLDLR
jgi:hypothetical protein